LSDELLEVEQGSLYPAVYRTRVARLDQFQDRLALGIVKVRKAV
jgi:hypothetical protein